MHSRLQGLSTLRIDETRKIPFRYQGKKRFGVKGDTIATALYACGIRIFGRSLKYHRPRGLYSLDGESANTLMEVNGIPNVCCETTQLTDGMIIKAQNVKRTVEHDRLGFLDKLDRLMPAGFYYTTLHKPPRIWPIALKQIRKAAGVGKISPEFTMKGRYDEIYPSTDMVVIGGGPSGMSAALAAAAKGLRIILMEKRPWLGGFFDYRISKNSLGQRLCDRARELAAEVDAAKNIRVFTRTAMMGAYTNNLITGFQTGTASDGFDQRYIEIRAKSVVVATGAIERPLIFENNERPGVMQAGCALRLADSYGILPGKKAVFSIGHDLGLETAAVLWDLGLKIPCVADIREDGQDPKLTAALHKRGIKLLKGWVAVKAHGGKTVDKLTVATLTGTVEKSFSCDIAVASAGLTPLTGPVTLAGGRIDYDEHTGCFLPSIFPEKMHAAGRVLGFDDGIALERSGKFAGLAAALDCGACAVSEVETAKKEMNALPGPSRGTKFISAPVKGRKSFICFDEDTTLKNINQAIEKGFDGPELIKRYTSAGTGPGQGGIPGHNLPLYIATAQALAPMTLKPTTVRSPLVPPLIATLAGSRHSMIKRTPLHEIQKKAGAHFRTIGVWRRARYFSDDFTCKKEIETVRNNVGMLDASTLGKFRIFGRDALKVLQKVYISDMSTLKEGRVKYSAMCNDDGCVLDDGVVVKQGDNDYYFTTSTGRAGQTVEWIRYHTRYEDWQYHLVNLTDAMGVINLAGPNARKVLERLTDTDLSNRAFEFAGYRTLTLENSIPVRAMRLGFVGELSYELHIPSSYTPWAWNMLKEAGRSFGIRPFGLEAQNVLRMEKGHIILGQESEQRTNLIDLGLGFLWDRSKTDAGTVGTAALRQSEHDPGRLKLVGFTMKDSTRAPKDGSIIVDSIIRGYVCTARYSHTLDKAVGMALVESELASTGSELQIFEDEYGGVRIYGRVVKMPFYDPDGTRMRQ